MQNIRNIGIIAHIDAGKTTLAERILFYTKEIHRMGEVDDGAATMDYMPEEQERGITIVASCSCCVWDDTRINLIDTPGHVDFTIEVERTLRVLDGAVCVLCATSGVEPQSETVWRQSEKFHIPKIIFVNKMDRVGADFKQAVESVRSRLGANPLPIQLPIMNDDVFEGIIDLITLEQIFFDQSDQGVSVSRKSLTKDLLDVAKECQEELYEGLADVDEEFMELYLGEKELTSEDVNAALRRATMALKATPVLFGSALQNIGVQPLLDAVLAYLPSPDSACLPKAISIKNSSASREILLQSDPSGPLAVLIFKVVLESGHPVVFGRIYSGTLNKGDICYNASIDKDEKIALLYHMHAEDKEAVQTVFAGDVVAFGGLNNVRTGHTLCDKNFPLLLEDISAYSPVISLALEAANSEEGKKIDEALKHYLLEDPTLKLEYDEDTGQRIISGMGELHLEIILERMKREYGLSPRFGEPHVVYKETITAQAEASLAVNREIGGTVHQGEVSLEVQPLSRGQGNKIEFAIATDCPEQGSVKKGQAAQALSADQAVRAEICQTVETALQGGPLGGYDVNDVLVRITDYARKQGAGLSMATVGAVKEALQMASPALLEPVMSLEISSPQESVGDVLNLLTTCNGRILEISSEDSFELIKAQAPMRNLFGFATSLRSVSKGRAGLTLTFAQFDIWQ